MVRSCVSRARESLGALGRAERDNDSGQDEHLREFHLNLSSVREPETIVVIFYRTRAHRILLLRAFSSSPRLTSRYKASRSLASCGPRASRVARARRASPVRAMLAARDRRSRGVAGFARSPPGLFGNFPVSKSPRGSSRERGSEALRRSKRSAWRPSIVSVSRLALVLSRVSMLTAPVSRTRAARRPSDGALATLRRPLPETAASSAKKTLRAVDGARPTLSYPRLLMNGNASRPAGASRTCLNLHWSPL